ncbi:unnamed protein product [Paramecium sonneborni]|uniref:Uncharacterized protein n=1 Tax=Paramecium sonneborni TaxID=65129 RepID=A0A8S1KEG3_9CILI|nr:unnamed protein product [Paramecium sonneborni]
MFLRWRKIFQLIIQYVKEIQITSKLHQQDQMKVEEYQNDNSHEHLSKNGELLFSQVSHSKKFENFHLFNLQLKNFNFFSYNLKYQNLLTNPRSHNNLSKAD